MPLILWGYLGVLAGLLGGRAVGFGAALLLAGLAAVIGALTRREWAAPVLLVAVAAAAVGATLPDARRPPPAASAGFLGAQRARADRAVSAVFRGDAPMARALLLADESEIPWAVKRRYADAGIIHMLSISGLHVALLAVGVRLLLGLLCVRTSAAAVATTVVVTWYVAVIGFPPPALRAAVMLAAQTAARARERHTSRWAVLALGGLVPLAQPLVAAQLGYQLSVAGMAALLAAAAAGKRVHWPDTPRGRRLLRAGLTSVLAAWITAPLVAATIGRLSLIAPATNLIADPILALAQPMLFLALVLALFPWGARFVADAAHPLLLAFDGVAAVAARVPGASVAVHPSPVGACLAACAAAALVVACVSPFPGRALLCGGAAIAAAAWIA